MSGTSDETSVSIVLLGQFNPAIFSPAWIEKIGLVSADEAAAADVKLIHRDIAAFSLGAYEFDVRRRRFSIDVTTEPFVAALDAVLVIFGEQLRHTSITEFGINYLAHFSVGDATARLQLGRTLAPLVPWGDFGRDIEALEGTLTSGLMELVMIQNYDPKDSGQRRVSIEPSGKVETEDGGVFMNVNDHRKILDHAPEEGSEKALHLLGDIFDSSLEKARNIVTEMQQFARSLQS